MLTHMKEGIYTMCITQMLCLYAVSTCVCVCVCVRACVRVCVVFTWLNTTRSIYQLNLIL